MIIITEAITLRLRYSESIYRSTFQPQITLMKTYDQNVETFGR